MSQESWNTWEKINGNDTLLYDFPLNKDGVVYDIGGHKGDWAESVSNLYDCNIYIYEPVDAFYQALCRRFKPFPKVRVSNRAAYWCRSKQIIGVNGSSSGFFDNSPGEEVDCVDIVEEIGPEKIDLMKINIEGAEYNVLWRLLQADKIKDITNILIQFHDNVPDHSVIRQSIRLRLALTHQLIFDFPDVWECWRVK